MSKPALKPPVPTLTKPQPWESSHIAAAWRWDGFGGGGSSERWSHQLGRSSEYVGDYASPELAALAGAQGGHGLHSGSIVWINVRRDLGSGFEYRFLALEFHSRKRPVFADVLPWLWPFLLLCGAGIALAFVAFQMGVWS